MYKFFYDVLIPLFKLENIKLNYMDTDSFIFTILNIEDVYKIILENREHFDLSEFTANHYFIDENGKPKYQENAKKLGKFKLENNGYITEFIGLRAKMYAYKEYHNNNEEQHKRCKGIKKSIVENDINFDMYYDALFNSNTYYNKQNLIKSEKYNINTITQEKISISPFDDKNYIIDGINSIPF